MTVAMPVQPDRLCALDRVKLMLGLALDNTAQDFLLLMLVDEISSLITESCNRSFFLLGNPANPIVEPRTGQGDTALVLRQWPIQCPVTTGNTTLGSAVITALPTTVGLFAGQSVCGTPLPAGAFILSVDSASQVTLTNTAPASANATAAATGTEIRFGVAVWCDDGSWNTGAPPTTRLVEESDYRIERDQPDGASRSATLFRLFNTAWGGTWGYGTGGIGLGGIYPGAGVGSYGAVKVQYACGFKFVPRDLEWACIRAVIRARNSRRLGQPLASETHPSYSYSVGKGANATIPMGLLDEDIGAAIRRYRVTPFPVS